MHSASKLKSRWLNRDRVTKLPRALRLSLLIVAISLLLTACAVSPKKDDSPASDLHVLQATMHKQLAPRVMANGKTYCLEDSANREAYDDCAADLEEYAWMSEEDKRRALRTFDDAIEVLENSTWWQRLTQKFRHR